MAEFCPVRDALLTSEAIRRINYEGPLVKQAAAFQFLAENLMLDERSQTFVISKATVGLHSSELLRALLHEEQTQRCVS